MASDQVGEKLGPAGLRTARNLKELRERRGFTVRELYQRLKELGRPILPTGITRAEGGCRRIDVDDLLALALALGVSPNRLLLDPDADDSEVVALTEAVTTTRWASWAWATGTAPLPSPDGSDTDPDALFNYQRENRPHAARDVPWQDLVPLTKTLVPAFKAAKASEVPLRQVADWFALQAALEETGRGMVALQETVEEIERTASQASKRSHKKITREES